MTTPNATPGNVTLLHDAITARLRAEASIEPDPVPTGEVKKETQIIAIYGNRPVPCDGGPRFVSASRQQKRLPERSLQNPAPPRCPRRRSLTIKASFFSARH